MNQHRGTFHTPGKESPYRNRSIEENLQLFKEMRAGKYKDGEKTLRAKIDMTSPNLVMRDPVIYRIVHISHHNTGDTWCIYPMYDYAHPLEDAIEGITHSLCSIEFENNRPLYNWFVEQVGFDKPPRQIEFGKLKLTNTIMGKRNLRVLVEEGKVSGWDDPRLPTLKGLRRRGYTPEIIKNFCETVGISKADSIADITMLEHAARDVLKLISKTVMAVTNPIKVVITNYPQGEVEYLPLENNGEVDMGARDVSFSREIYIEGEDFSENPPKKFHRLTLGGEVRLKGAYFIKCNEIVKDEKGNIIELHCTYDPETKSGSGFTGRKVKGTIHWVSASSCKPAKLNIFGYLTTEDGEFNENSLRVKEAYVEDREYLPRERYQFIRNGYFVLDQVVSGENLEFNCVVSLKSSY